MHLLKKLLDLLSLQEKKQGAYLLLMILVMAFLDMLGVASILPFIAVLANQELVESNKYLNAAFKGMTIFGINTINQFLFVLGIGVFVTLVVSMIFKITTTYAQIRFNLMREYSISKRMVEGYLRQPYSWFLNRHSSNLGTTVLSEVSLVINRGMMPLGNIVAQGSVSITLFILLIMVDPLLAIIVFATLGFAYASIFGLVSGTLKRKGKESAKANKERFYTVNEVFGAVKEVKVNGLEYLYIKRYISSAQIYAKTSAFMQVTIQLPRYALEAISFGGMILVILYLMNKKSNFTEVIPIVSLYAFAGYRLMPALQQIYGSITSLRYVSSSLDSLHTDLMSLNTADKNQDSNSIISLSTNIKLNKITYFYPNTKQPAINGIDLTINAYTTVGLVGTTGSGKTTTADLILGLLEPKEGKLLVDGQEINTHNLRQWQRIIGYVPQQIYLADDSIEANIAFGVEPKNIDFKMIEQASKIAKLNDFILKELPEGYKTTVGERGIRLSGGQRQRIGIARALYHNPQVLILDEATSALDGITEKAVMDAINNLGKKITIIIIAHRLSTVRNCDNIYLFNNGKIDTNGRYDELIKMNKHFKEMAEERNIYK